MNQFLILAFSIVGLILCFAGFDEDFMVFYAAVLALWALTSLVATIRKLPP